MGRDFWPKPCNCESSISISSTTDLQSLKGGRGGGGIFFLVAVKKTDTFSAYGVGSVFKIKKWGRWELRVGGGPR